MVDLLWILLKIILYLLLALVVYIGYIGFYIPIKARRKYSQFKNVHVSQKFIPLLGDAGPYLEDTNNNRAHYDHKRRIEHQMGPDIDLKLEQLGTTPMLLVISHKALKELLSQIPTKIDRFNFDKHKAKRSGFLKTAAGCFVNSPSTKRILERRKNLAKMLSLRSVSKHLPIIIKCAEFLLSKMKKQKEVNITEEITLCTNRILVSILFGQDFDKKGEDSYEYVQADGTITYLDICSYFSKFALEMAEESTNPLTLFFPIMNITNVVNPWKRNHKNGQSLYRAVKHIIANSQDEDSMWSKISKVSDFTDQEILPDLMILLLAGSETTADNFTSVLYYLKKYPDVKAKLMKELEENDITPGCNALEKITVENIQECDYLSNVVKESLRIDPPLLFSLSYEAYADTEICGVPIEKGTVLLQTIIDSNTNHSDWLEPNVFEPERHNPESEFYNESKKKEKIQNVYSRRTFGHGPRSCPGMILATLELKIFTAYFITQMEYDVAEEDLSNDHIGFGIGGKFNPKFKIY
ncbi:unnamed protein product [Moneuplotes crassus]|uniref:Cytochrome P450 n=1 Tax=Euplotes crassus TaxID=5936 RepID=A0AAD1UGC7_EUPCR|nr:unnamed protein product [Moneuplotes crassus]